MIGAVKLANRSFAHSGIGTIPAVVLNAGANGVITWLAGRAWGHIVIEEDLEQSIENITSTVLRMVGYALGVPR